MRMPGFSAEASLYRNSEANWFVSAEINSEEGLVIPAEYADGTNMPGSVTFPGSPGVPTIPERKCCKWVQSCHIDGYYWKNGMRIPKMHCLFDRVCVSRPAWVKCPTGYQ
jgi:hypothetical protein